MEELLLFVCVLPHFTQVGVLLFWSQVQMVYVLYDLTNTRHDITSVL